jgi:hypothetical protein
MISSTGPSTAPNHGDQDLTIEPGEAVEFSTWTAH